MRYDAADPRLARPRPVRPVGRPRVDPAVLDALPHRLRPRRSTTSRTSASGARTTPGPPRGAPHRRASRSPPARSARASPTASAWRIAEHCAAGPLRRRAVRPPHLRDRRRRLTSRRASATRPRRSPATSASAGSSYVYDDNHITIDGPTELALHDDAGEALRGLRLARRPRRRDRQRPRRARGGDPPGHGRRGPAVADRPAQPHRLPVAQVHRHRARPRQPARRRRDRAPPRRSWACPRRDVLGARRRARPSTARPARRGVGPPARPGSSATPRWTERPGRARRRASAGTGLPGWADDAARRGSRGEKVATRNAGKAVPQRPPRRRARPRSAAAPTSPATPAPQLHGRRRRSPSSTRPAARSTSASASTAWARS